MTDLTPFAERIIELKQDYNLNNLDLEKVCGCNNSSVSQWINKNAYPKLVNLLRLSNYFNCSIDYILNLTENRDVYRSSNPSTFVERFLKLAAEKKVSRNKIAIECNYHPANFTKWNSRKLLPHPIILISLAKYFECSVEYLIGLSDFK